MSRSPKATREVSARHGIPWRAAGLLLVAVFALTGAEMVAAALTAAQVPPPPQSPAPVVAPPAPRATAPPAPEDEPPLLDTAPAGLPRSAPTGIRIPGIDVDAELMRLGIDRSGMIEVPPLEEAHLAGWYELGPSPGETGNAVVVGHLDSYAMGPAVFFRLGALKPGDTIEVTRADGAVVTFTVDGVASYPKEEFPTDLVYAATERPQLRLITCGGTFDRVSAGYPDNVIVTATLTEIVEV